MRNKNSNGYQDPNKGLTEVLIFAFGIGCVWDVVTTFLGVVKILGSTEWGAYGMAFVGACIVFAFNLATRQIWEDFKNDNWILIVPWGGCILFDFVTSLEGNYKYVIFSRESNSTVTALIWFITFLTTISPMMVNKLSTDLKNKP
jgi:hypothetical protein